MSERSEFGIECKTEDDFFRVALIKAISNIEGTPPEQLLVLDGPPDWDQAVPITKASYRALQVALEDAVNGDGTRFAEAASIHENGG